MSLNAKTESKDSLKYKMCGSKDVSNKTIASASTKVDTPFDFVRVLLEGAIAGAAAGVVVESILYPLDTIKTRLQAVRGGGKIILKGLYSGLAGNLAGVLPASAIFIGVYEPTKQKLLESVPENLSALAHLTAGAVGGAASSIVRVPTEVVKQRMQTGHFASAPDAVRLIIAKEGFKGLYAGYGSFLLRDLPFDAIQFCIYEQLRIGYKLAAKRNLSDPENAVIGAFADPMDRDDKGAVMRLSDGHFAEAANEAITYDTVINSVYLPSCNKRKTEQLNVDEACAITGAVTTPLDVIKTRLMVQGAANQYRSISHCVGTILKEEGPSAFLKGIGPRVLWIGIGGSIFFGVLERTKQMLEGRHPSVQSSDSGKLD